MYKANQPYASRDWKRMQEVAEYTVPLVDLTRKADPEASISAQLDALTERDAVIAIRPGKYSEWDVFQEQMPEFLKILSGADSMAIFPLLKERLEAVLVFLGPENG